MKVKPDVLHKQEHKTAECVPQTKTQDNGMCPSTRTQDVSQRQEHKIDSVSPMTRT